MPGAPLTRQSKIILADMRPDWWSDQFDRIACGENPKRVAEEVCVLWGVFQRHIEADPALASEYAAALRIAAEGHAHDCISIADEQKEAVGPGGKVYDPDVARDKLRIETRLKLAGKWDRARYGETVKHEHTGALVLVDAGLIGFASDLLKRIAAPTRRELDVTPQQESTQDSTRVIDVSREDDCATSAAPLAAVESPHHIAAPQASIEESAIPAGAASSVGRAPRVAL